ncbi:unnamed protein product [Closterium sp. Naga37s-1]|nr:unnamed protein product [Closterium sp. Naga37s-1]
MPDVYLIDPWRAGEMQTELEVHDGVSAGKYTIGLGQDEHGFCCDQEDVISMSLTAVQRLLENNGIDASRIGRLEVGTETVIDKSKSIKTAIMTLFEASGNADVEGVDSCNACYGGTAALLNSVNWVEGSSWDGRFAIVVAVDSAVYAEGPARPTGGAGAVAMLVGPDAPLAMESGLAGSYAAHAYDFYKPKLASEYPVVDGKLSQTCYTKALDHCYQRFCEKYAKKHGSAFSLGDTESVVFHSPYNKLVQKSLARLVFNDVKRGVSSSYLGAGEADALQPFVGLDEEKSLTDRDLEKTAMRVAGPVYSSKVGPTTLVGKRVGNMYCASLYGSLASLLAQQGQQLEGRRILLFSYGSGLMSTLFSLTVRQAADPFSLATLTTHLDVHQLLESRTKVLPPLQAVSLPFSLTTLTVHLDVNHLLSMQPAAPAGQWGGAQAATGAGAGAGGADEPRTLWVGDLQYWMDETYLWNAFASTGQVANAKIIRNRATGQPEGYGFVEFTTHAAAEQALAAYQGTPMPQAEQQPFRINWAAFGAGEKGRLGEQQALAAYQGTPMPRAEQQPFRINWAAFGAGEKGGGRPADGQEFSIFVGDLAPDVNDYLLCETFRCRYGSVRGAKVVVDNVSGRTKGYGFVVVDNVSGRTKGYGLLCKGLNPPPFPTTPLHHSAPPSCSICHFPSTEQQVVVDNVSGRTKGYGFVRFSSEEERDRALHEMNGQMCSSRPMRISVATPKKPGAPGQGGPQGGQGGGPRAGPQPQVQGPGGEDDPSNTTIFVGGLDQSVTDEQLRAVFGPWGELVYVKIPFGKGCGFVQFRHRSQAEEALRNMHGTVIGQQSVRLSWGRNPASKRTSTNPSQGSQWQQPQQQHDPNTAAAGGWGAAAGNTGYYGGYSGYDASGGYNQGAYASYGGYGGYGGYGQQQAWPQAQAAPAAAAASPATTPAPQSAAAAPASGFAAGVTPEPFDPLRPLDVDKMNAQYMAKHEGSLVPHHVWFKMPESATA